MVNEGSIELTLHPITPTRPRTPLGKARTGTRLPKPRSLTIRSQGIVVSLVLLHKAHTSPSHEVQQSILQKSTPQRL